MEKYYTVEQVAGMLGMHPKTIQRYVREGRLRAAKIGKGWRVTGHDLSVFTESESGSASPRPARAHPPAREKVRVSCVADIAVGGMDEAGRVMNTLTAVLNAKPPEYGQSSMHAQYIEHEGLVRVTLWGGARFMEAILGSVAVLAETAEDDGREQA